MCGRKLADEFDALPGRSGALKHDLAKVAVVQPLLVFRCHRDEFWPGW